MPRISVFGACAGLAALLISTAAVGQEDRLLTGSVTYLDRMGMPPGATVLVDLFGLDRQVLAESRMVTEGEQVPIPFEIAVPAQAEGTLRAGISAGGRMVWVSDPLAIAPDTPPDLGEIILSRHQPMGFAAAFRCGGQTIHVGFAGDDAVMDTGDVRLLLQPVPAASGARYESADDPGTWFWNQGDNALVSIEGTELPECHVTFPMDDTPYRASGNEPFWSLVIEAGEMTLTRLGMDDLTMPVTETAMTDAGDILVIAADPERALRTVIVRSDSLCRDTMTGMPHPETVSVSMGDNTITGCGGDPWRLMTGRTWVVEDIGGAGVIDTARATLGFLPTGRVFGSGSCNRYNGAASLTGEGLSFGPLASTMMACPEAVMGQERRLFDALEQVTGFDIDATGALILRGPSGPLITARAATDGSDP